jgi:hypothetical protein
MKLEVNAPPKYRIIAPTTKDNGPSHQGENISVVDEEEVK